MVEFYAPHLTQVLYAVCAFQERKIVVRRVEEQSGSGDAVEVSTRKRSVVDKLTVGGDCKTYVQLFDRDESPFLDTLTR